jgi:hypothetical protein
MAKMKAEKIASTVNAVKTAEPEQIDVPLLSKKVIKGKFKDNPDIQSYTGTYDRCYFQNRKIHDSTHNLS